jgi:hypothetical protein
MSAWVRVTAKRDLAPSSRAGLSAIARKKIGNKNETSGLKIDLFGVTRDDHDTSRKPGPG